MKRENGKPTSVERCRKYQTFRHQTSLENCEQGEEKIPEDN